MGKVLSDSLTRNLIIGILLMLMVLPQISYSTENYTGHTGLRELFKFGRSSCRSNEDTDDTFCDSQTWITQEGWNEKLRQFITAQSNSDNIPVEKEVLWIYVPVWSKNGMIESIESIPDKYDKNTNVWTQS